VPGIQLAIIGNTETIIVGADHRVEIANQLRLCGVEGLLWSDRCNVVQVLSRKPAGADEGEGSIASRPIVKHVHQQPARISCVAKQTP
jgi:hypothetical protein